MAVFQESLLQLQNSAALRFPPFGFQPAQTDARFSTSPPAVFLNAASTFLKDKSSSVL
jgi:hypothetical protein